MPIPSDLLLAGQGGDAGANDYNDINDNADGQEVKVLVSSVRGGLKRVGGQGDILSGSTGVLMAWGAEWVKGTYE
jgi:hypothetical protein